MNNYQVELTNICNLKCIGCPNHILQRKRGYMKPETFRVALTKIKEASHTGVRIALHGNGEPLLSPYLFECLDIAKELGFFNVDFSTNGTLLTLKICERLKEYAGVISCIKVSLNTTNRELFNIINTGSDYDKVISNIQMLLDQSMPFEIRIQILKTSENWNENEHTLRSIFSGHFKPQIAPYHTFANLVDESGLNKDEHRTCHYGQDFINIHWDGDMNGCCVDVTKDQISGNILTDDIFNDNFYSLRNQSQRNDLCNLPMCRRCRGSI